MSLRKAVGLLTGFALAIGLIGAGVSASFTDSVTAQENINVGTFSCGITATSAGGQLGAPGANGYAHSVTYTAPTIMKSVASSLPFSFTVLNVGSIPDVLTVATSAVTTPPWSIIGAPFAPVALASGASNVYNTGVSWTELGNGDLGAHFTVTWTVNCGEVPAPWTLYGDATVVDGAAQLVWSQTQAFGGVELAVPAGLTIGSLNSLSANYKFTVGTCSNASPRFAIDVTNGTVHGTIQVLLGPQGNNSASVPCAAGTYMDSGNVLGAGYGADATQIGGGYVAPGTWATFQTGYGTYSVTGLRLVVDGWTAANITAQVNQIKVNGTTITF